MLQASLLFPRLVTFAFVVVAVAGPLSLPIYAENEIGKVSTDSCSNRRSLAVTGTATAIGRNHSRKK
jgi:hypothetical protein